MWALLIPLLAAALSGGVQMVNKRNASEDQQHAELQGLRNNAKLHTQAVEQTQKLLDNLAQSSPQQAENTRAQALQDVLSANRAHATMELQPVGNVSGAYQQAAGNAANAITNYGDTNVSQLAAMAAPKLQRQKEHVQMQNFADALNGINDRINSNDFLTKLRLQSIYPDPRVAMLAGLIGGAGQTLGRAFETQPMNYSDWLNQQPLNGHYIGSDLTSSDSMFG